MDKHKLVVLSIIQVDREVNRKVYESDTLVVDAADLELLEEMTHKLVDKFKYDILESEWTD